MGTWGQSESLPEPHPFCLLGVDGSPRSSDSFAISTAELVRAYELMRITRAIDEEATLLQRQGQLGVYAASLGQEAIQVGAALAMDRGRDWIFPAYRELGTAVAWGVDPSVIMHMWRGTWFSDYDLHDLRYGMQTIPVGTQLLHAVGFAKGMELARDEGVVLTFIGDGATSEGDFHEALNFAGVWQVPCVFVVQNNGYAISVPFSEQTRAARLAWRGVGYGIPAMTVDGNDVVACWDATRDAVARARAGGGPSLIEAMTYRAGPHTSSDDPGRYRSATEEEAWRQREPLRRVHAYLEKEGAWDQERESHLSALVASARKRLRDEIYDAPHGDPMELFEHVYVDPTGHFDGQRDQLKAELDAMGVEHGDGEVR